MKDLFNKLNRYENFGLNTVLFIVVTASFLSFIFYYNQDLLLAYGDSKAHLVLSRRVFSSLTPSLTQLGAIWLPLPHLLNMLTVWNDFMFYSGISGSIVSMTAFIGSALLIYKSIYAYTQKNISSVIGSLIFILNPSLLYLQSTPMTESLSIFFFLLSVYLLIKWAKTSSIIFLIIAAIATALSTLCRYDNWFLLPCVGLTILVVNILKRSRIKLVEGSLILYFTLASFGVFLWVLYNQIIFSNPLNFALGPGSAAWYASAQHSTSKHNLFTAVGTYFWTSADAAGLISLSLMSIGLFIFVFKRRLKAESIPAFLFLAPIVFNTLSLFMGQSIIFTQHLEPFTLYNSRYGVNAIPAVAFFVGFIFISKKWALNLIIFLMIVTQFVILYKNPITVLSEVHYGQTKVNKKATKWVIENPTKGNTLLSDLSLGSQIGFDAKIPQSTIISEANGKYWKTSLTNPKKYATRIIMSKQFNGNDIVWKKLYKSKILDKDYKIVFNQDNVVIYDLKASRH